MYTHHNFKTKKELKEAVQAWCKGIGPPVRYFQPGPYKGSEPKDGIIFLEGPHFPEPHKWYAQAEVVDWVIVRVK